MNFQTMGYAIAPQILSGEAVATLKTELSDRVSSSQLLRNISQPKMVHCE